MFLERRDLGGVGQSPQVCRRRAYVQALRDVQGLGAIDWAAVKAATYLDPLTNTTKPITDVEINRFMQETNWTKAAIEAQLTTEVLINNIRGQMLGGKGAVIDPKLMVKIEKGWWGTFFSDFATRMKKSLGWPLIGIGTVAGGVVLYGLYRRIAGKR
jgi:hypothetical protein